MDPALVAVIVTIAVIAAAVLVSGWVGTALRGWRDSLAGLDTLDSEASDDDDGELLREEVRQLVVADNERRARRGEPPLDVEAEVERKLSELQGP